MQVWRLLPFHTFDGYTNMAIDEYFFNQIIASRSPNILRFYQWNPSTATIGRNQSLTAEIDTHFASTHNVQVVRRITGGGAVLHAKDAEITYSVICKVKDIPQLVTSPRIYDKSIPDRYILILEAIAQALEFAGYPIDVGKIHCPALLTGGKKISGNAQAIKNGVLLQHGTILLDVDPEFMYRVLKAPEGVSYSRMVQSVRSKVIGLHDLVQNKTKVENNHENKNKQLIQALISSFQTNFRISIVSQPISAQEFLSINHLSQSRYATPEWLMKYP